MDKCLETALHLHGRGRRVDPAKGDEGEDRESPGERESDRNAEQYGSEPSGAGPNRAEESLPGRHRAGGGDYRGH